MQTPFRLLAAVYTFFLAFVAITVAQGHQGRGESPRPRPPLWAFKHNENHPTAVPGAVNVRPPPGGNRVIEARAEPTGKPQQFPQGNGRNIAFSRTGGHRVSLKDIDHSDRTAFESKQNIRPAVQPLAGVRGNSTNSTVPIMRRWTNPYKLPTKETKGSTMPSYPLAKYPPRKARRRWFIF